MHIVKIVRFSNGKDNQIIHQVSRKLYQAEDLNLSIPHISFIYGHYVQLIKKMYEAKESTTTTKYVQLIKNIYITWIIY